MLLLNMLGEEVAVHKAFGAVLAVGLDVVHYGIHITKRDLSMRMGPHVRLFPSSEPKRGKAFSEPQM